MASLMAHSCVVNAQISITSDWQMFVKATVPIQEGRDIVMTADGISHDFLFLPMVRPRNIRQLHGPSTNNSAKEKFPRKGVGEINLFF